MEQSEVESAQEWIDKKCRSIFNKPPFEMQNKIGIGPRDRLRLEKENNHYNLFLIISRSGNLWQESTKRVVCKAQTPAHILQYITSSDSRLTGFGHDRFSVFTPIFHDAINEYDKAVTINSKKIKNRSQNWPQPYLVAPKVGQTIKDDRPVWIRYCRNIGWCITQKGKIFGPIAFFKEQNPGPLNTKFSKLVDRRLIAEF